MFGLGKIIRKTALVLGAVAVAALARPYIVGVDVSWVLEDESLGVKISKFSLGKVLNVKFVNANIQNI